MINLEELDKKISIQSAWLMDTDYEIILVANRETLSALALTLGETTLADGKYKGYKVQEDNGLKTDIFVLKVEKKGEK